MGRKKKNDIIINEAEEVIEKITESIDEDKAIKYQIIGNFKELGLIDEVFNKNDKHKQLIQNKLLLTDDMQLYNRFIEDMLKYNIIKKYE